MTLDDFVFCIDFGCETPWMDHARIRSETHVPSFGRELFLVIHDMDDILISFWCELFTRCGHEPEDIPSELDRHDLRPEADAEIGNTLLSRILSRHDHTLRSTYPESSWYTDSIESFEEFCSLFLYILRFDEADFYPFFTTKCCALESFIE